MFGYYTFVIIFGVFIMLTMITLLFADEILPKEIKNFFVLAVFTLIYASIAQWIVATLELTNSSHHLLTTFLMASILFICPAMPVVIAWAAAHNKGIKFNRIVIALLLLDFIIPFSSLFFDFIFYYDANNIYHKGQFFIIYIIPTLASIYLLFINAYLLSKHYQSKGNYILLLILILFSFGCLLHVSTESISILWITSATSFTIIYIYYVSIINQNDVLTGLLNRQCYENQIYDIKSNAIIIIMDVNKFKYINDTYGHSIGDVVLTNVGQCIKKTYGNYGKCYRTGGDEFCVIMTKNIENIVSINRQLNELLSNTKCDIALPSMSIGFSLYYPNSTNVHKALEDADIMMYNVKNKS